MTETTDGLNLDSAACVAYISHCEPEAGTHYGALMVVDCLGTPLAFVHSNPAIKPSMLQIKMYGKRLIPHIVVDLLAKPLISKIDAHPLAFLISSPSMLRLWKVVNVPILLVSEGSEPYEELPEGFCPLLPTDSEVNTVNLENHCLLTPEKVRASLEPDISHFLADLQSSVGITEPFNRMDAMLRLLHEEPTLIEAQGD